MSWRSSFVFLGCLALMGIAIQAAPLTAVSGTLRSGSLTVAYTHAPTLAGRPLGKVLFLHGYGDRSTNHLPLFEEIHNAGFEVLSFDFPSHGLTKGPLTADLELQSFTSLAHIARDVISHVWGPKLETPFYLAGWSLGGLLATRIAQSPALRGLFPPIHGLILLAPGISVFPCVGNARCRITNPTLTHNATLYSRPIAPAAPLLRPQFGLKTMANAALTWRQALPGTVSTLVLLAGDKHDRYVNTPEIKRWIRLQRSRFHATLTGVQCPQARHELDNELDVLGGTQVRRHIVEFLLMLHGSPHLGPHQVPGPCFVF